MPPKEARHDARQEADKSPEKMGYTSNMDTDTDEMQLSPKRRAKATR